MSVKVEVSGKNLIITTDTIDNTVIYKLKTEHIIFQGKPESGFKLNFEVTLDEWTLFVSQLKSLTFMGILQDNQFHGEHLKNSQLEYLHIGGTNYQLFENQTELPMIKTVILWGLGKVYINKEHIWLKELTSNGCSVDIYLENLF
jgi:hypothetical protein